MSFNFDDMKNRINKYRYIIYPQLYQNLMKTWRTPLKVEMNAKDGSCKY